MPVPSKARENEAPIETSRDLNGLNMPANNSGYSTGLVQPRDIIFNFGEVPEWLNGTVSKTVMAFLAIVGSNPTLSA